MVLSLSASQLTLLRHLNSHFLYKIDALTAALVRTRLHTVTPEFSSGSEQPHPSSPLPHSSLLLFSSHLPPPLLSSSPVVPLVEVLLPYTLPVVTSCLWDANFREGTAVMNLLKAAYLALCLQPLSAPAKTGRFSWSFSDVLEGDRDLFSSHQRWCRFCGNVTANVTSQRADCYTLSIE